MSFHVTNLTCLIRAISRLSPGVDSGACRPTPRGDMSGFKLLWFSCRKQCSTERIKDGPIRHYTEHLLADHLHKLFFVLAQSFEIRHKRGA